MKREYIWFNSIGIFLSIGFGLATAWQWRFLYFELKVAIASDKEDHGVISYADFVEQASSSNLRENTNQMTQVAEATSTITNITSNTMVNSSSVMMNDSKNVVTSSTSTEHSAEQKKEPVVNLTTAYSELQGIHDGVIINLDVPFASQAPEKIWELPWQEACEEVAVLMLDAYYKGYGLSPMFARDEIIKMIEWEEEQGWGTSITIEKIQELYEHFFPKGKRPRIVANPTAKHIKEFVRSGKPVLAVAYGKSLPNKWYSNDGPEYHALIIRGFTDESFITNDPGVNRGKNFAFPIDALMNSIHDWNNGDVQNGRSAILVLE